MKSAHVRTQTVSSDRVQTFAHCIKNTMIFINTTHGKVREIESDFDIILDFILKSIGCTPRSETVNMKFEYFSIYTNDDNVH